MTMRLPQLDDANLTISQLDPKLIHQVLLTRPSKFSALHVSGAPRSTPSFDEFVESFLEDDSLESVMKRAYRDHVIDAACEERLEPLHQLMLDLHRSLRSLVPHRTDLHSALDDEKVRNASKHELFLLLLHASRCLQNLESPERVETTELWQKEAPVTASMLEDKEEGYIPFLVNSTFYHIYKTELCLTDKQDFYLQQIWAPRIHKEGPEYARALLKNDHQSCQVTKTWIKELVQSAGEIKRHEVKQSRRARQAVLRRGWIENLLFRKSDATTLPEVFALDSDNISMIRHVCKRAVAGCALALHAGISQTERVEPTSNLGFRRADLIQAMGRSNLIPTRYEEGVSQAVVELAKVSATLDEVAEKTLENRTIAVLRGEDHVIQLLDRRMQQAFVEIVTCDAPVVPASMETGRVQPCKAASEDTATSEFEREAEVVFCKKGLSFYAPELASLSLFAKEIVDLAWSVHMALLEEAFLDAVTEIEKS
jgi:hypothetical protein